MTADELASHLSTLGQQLAEASDTGNAGRDSVLEQARVFLFTYLPQEPHVPYRADELLAPSPHTHRSWEEERLLLLEGLLLLHQLWQPPQAPQAPPLESAPTEGTAPKRRVRRRIGPAPE